MTYSYNKFTFFRKLNLPRKNFISGKGTVPLLLPQEEYIPNLSTMNPTLINKHNYNSSANVGYKSLHTGQDTNNVDSSQTKIDQQDMMQPAYMNAGSDGNESVKYYVLEDAYKK